MGELSMVNLHGIANYVGFEHVVKRSLTSKPIRGRILYVRYNVVQGTASAYKMRAPYYSNRQRQLKQYRILFLL